MSNLSPDFVLPENFCANPQEAWTIPARFYTDQNAFEHEKENVFAKSWICVAHSSELANANDYVTREIIGESIVLVRGRDKVLRAFYNVCPHRGHQLLSGEGKAKNVITCPYHAWAFKLDGNLAHARNCENVANFDSDKAQLVPVRLEEYAGFVFINMDPNATSVEDQLPGLGAKVLEACPEVHDLKLAARFTTRTPANWKNIVDNYLECYHCGPAHPGFSDSVQVDRYWHTMHGNWTLQYGFAKPHLHHSSTGTRLELARLLADIEPGTHVYTCGPEALNEAVRSEAARLDIVADTLHFEQFAIEDKTGDAFTLVLARSGKEFVVPEEMTILQVIENNKAAKVECLCREGVCGTCETAILEGEADHRDQYFSDEERASQQSMLICCSRAKGKRLVLDL